MKIKIPKDSGHHEYDLLMPVLSVCDYDDKKYNSNVVNVAVGKSCQNMAEFDKERDRLFKAMFKKLCTGTVKIAFIPDFDPRYLSIDDKFKSIVYNNGVNRYILAEVCRHTITFGFSPDKKHITINYNNNAYVAANFDNKWYVIMIDEFVGNYIICGTLDMDTTTIEDLISYIEFETGWPHYHGLLEE